MKLRLQTNSLRLRLKRGEVTQLVREGKVEEVIAFEKNQVLRYRLQVSSTATTPLATFQAGEIIVELPAKIASHWASSEEVGVEATQDAGQEPLRILIEKDFACLNGPETENVDTFPNPLAGTKC